MAGKTVKVPATCPGGHKRAPGEVSITMQQLAPGMTKWMLYMEYGCDQCELKVFSLVLDALPDEVRDFEGNPVRIVKGVPLAHSVSDEGLEEIREHLASLAEPERGRSRWAKRRGAKRVEKAKRSYVEVADPESDSVRKLAESFTESDRQEFSAWLDKYKRADRLLEAAGGRSRPDPERRAGITNEAAVDAWVDEWLSDIAWLEAFADAGVALREDGSQEYVGVEEARKRLPGGGKDGRGSEKAMDDAKRGFVTLVDGSEEAWSPDVRSLSVADVEELGAWMHEYVKADRLRQAATEVAESADREAQRTGDVSQGLLIEAVSAQFAYRRALADLGVVLEDGHQIYVGVEKAQQSVPDDPDQYMQLLLHQAQSRGRD